MLERARAALAAHLAPRRGGPRDAALPGAAEAAARASPAATSTAAPTRASWRSSGDYSPAESVVQQALPGLEFSIDCLGDLDGRGAGRDPARDDPEQGRRADQGRDARRPPARGARGGRRSRRSGWSARARCSASARTARILGITDINTRFGGAFPLPAGRGGRLPADDRRASAAGERAGAARSARTPPGVVMTRFLDQTMLLREHRRASPRSAPWSRVRRRGSGDHPPGLRPRPVERPLADPGDDRRGRHRRARSYRSPRTTTYTATRRALRGPGDHGLGHAGVDAGHQPRHGDGRPDAATTSWCRSRRSWASRPARVRKRRHAQRPQGAGRTRSATSRPSSRSPSRTRTGDRPRRAPTRTPQVVYERAQQGFSAIIGQLRAGRRHRAAPSVDRLEAQIPLPAPARRDQRPAASRSSSSRCSAAPASSSHIATTELSRPAAATWSKEQQFQPVRSSPLGHEPELVRAASPTAPRTVVFAAILGFLVGIIVTFVWRGSPAGRAGRE